MFCRILVLAGTLSLAACSSVGPRNDIRTAATDLSLKAYNAYDAGDLTGAMTFWGEASMKTIEDFDAYNGGDPQLAKQQSIYYSNRAWVLLLQGQEKMAKQFYEHALDELRRGQEAHQRALQSDQDRNESILFGASLLLAAAVAKEQAKMPGAAPIDPNLLSKLVYIPKFDKVQLANQFPDYFETDGVRAILFPSLGWMENIVRVASNDGTCTGWVFGGVTVVTNAHCVTAAGGRPKPGPYVARFERLLGAEEYGVVAVHTHRDDGGWDGDHANDWAILELDRIFSYGTNGLKGVMWPGTDEERQELLNTRLMTAGYAGDLNNGSYLGMHWGCRGTGYSTNKHELHHACRTWFGASGSPIVIAEGKFAGYVVALHSFGFGNRGAKDFDSRRGGAVMVERFKDRLIQIVEARQKILGDKWPTRWRY